MTTDELARRRGRAEREVLVISQIPEGFRVYSPTDPRRTYTVRETEGRLVCSCPDFEKHAEDVEWRCKHVLAVERHEGDRYEREERVAIQTEGKAAPAAEPAAPTPPTAPAQMFMKRSVSPDGRIDSLSVGVSWPIEGVPASEMKRRVERVLKMQAEVVERFLKKTDETPDPQRVETESSQAAPARMLRIEGMDGRWGRRLFIAVETAGRTVRLFGTERQLGQAITDAGFPKVAAQVTEGTKLELPCRVVTKPTADGRYLNIERVLPAEDQRSRR